MNSQWDLTKIQQYITDSIPESLQLEYKAAAALAHTSEKKTKIAITVSAMANASGGIVIYGLKESSNENKPNVPEKIDPIDQTHFSKEWLEQVINSYIQPRINGILIYPILVDSSQTYVVYVIDIPQSTTAHQAADKRYYKRFNFLSTMMEDYEIRDVMNRASTPDAEIKFGLVRELNDIRPYACRRLYITVINNSNQVINRFKLNLRLENIGWIEPSDGRDFLVTDILEFGNSKAFTYSYCSAEQGERLGIDMVYLSTEVLFPKERINIGGYNLNWVFVDEPEWNDEQWINSAIKGGWTIEWTLYADNMPYKQEKVSVYKLI